jgi:hypothetical protein
VEKGFMMIFQRAILGRCLVVAFAGAWLAATASSCRKPSGVAQGADSGAALQRPDASAPRSRFDLAPSGEACTLVTKTEAEAVLGEPLQEPSVEYNGLCTYRRASDVGKTNSMPIIGIELETHRTKSQFEAEMANAIKITHSTQKALPGFGEEAFQIGDSQIGVLAHGRYISVVPYPPKFDRAKLEAFVRAALKRM